MTVTNTTHRLVGFRGLVYCTLFALLALPALFITPNPTRAQAPGSIPVFIELRASDTASMQDAVRRVEAHGGRCLQRFPYRTCLGDVPPTQLEALSAEAVVLSVHQGPLDRAALAAPDDNTDIALAVWNRVYVSPPPSLRAFAAGKEPPPPPHDALIPPARPAYGPSTAGAVGLPTNTQTSEYMIGSVAVGIIMPESSGSIDPSSEDWTTARQDQVVANIGNALNWWAQREPRAHLSFTWHVERSVPTGYEPISRPQSDERLWIGDVMGRLGYNSADYRDSVWSYDNALRTAAGTNWAFTIFVVDDVHDLDHMFADYLFAYAYVGGPFMVLTYNNDGYGISNMDAVTAHEMGHIFYALDEYGSANISCTALSGYLNAPNSNSQSPAPGACGLNVDSIMRGQVSPFVSGAISGSARAELGWRDSTGSGLLDPANTYVAASFWAVGSSLSGQGEVVRYAGQAKDNAWPSPTHNPVTINTITGVQYRVDNSGAWRSAIPTDGGWDQATESFTFSIGPLLPGPHIVTIQAFNSACTLDGVCNVGQTTRTDQVFGGAPGPGIYLPFVGKSTP